MSEADSASERFPAEVELQPHAVDGAEGAMAPIRLSGNLKIELPPAFKGDGTESFTSWSRRFEVAVQAMHPPATDLSRVLASVLPTCLSDAAFLYWDSLSPSVRQNYSQAKDKLRNVFGSKYTLPFFQTHVNARPRKPGESLDVYSADITRLVLEAFPTYDINAQEGEKFRRFVAGLDLYLQSKIHEMGASSMDEAVVVASRCERARTALQFDSSCLPSPDRVAMVRSKSSDDKLVKAVEQLTLTVSDLKNDVQQLQEKNANLTQRLDSCSLQLQQSMSSRARSPSPSYRHSQRYYSSPQHYGRDPEPYYTRRPASPDYSGQHGVDRHERNSRYRSPEHSPYSRYNSYSANDNSHRRSSSPMPKREREMSPNFRRGVRFQSPEKNVRSYSTKEGNFH